MRLPPTEPKCVCRTPLASPLASSAFDGRSSAAASAGTRTARSDDCARDTFCCGDGACHGSLSVERASGGVWLDDARASSPCAPTAQAQPGPRAGDPGRIARLRVLRCLGRARAIVHASTTLVRAGHRSITPALATGSRITACLAEATTQGFVCTAARTSSDADRRQHRRSVAQMGLVSAARGVCGAIARQRRRRRASSCPSSLLVRLVPCAAALIGQATRRRRVGAVAELDAVRAGWAGGGGAVGGARFGRGCGRRLGAQRRRRGYHRRSGGDDGVGHV